MINGTNLLKSNIAAMDSDSGNVISYLRNCQ